MGNQHQIQVKSEHPVSDAMRTTILQSLEALQRHHQVTVLYACESGSRGWGFASPDSDYDVRFVYVNRLPWYLTIDPGRDVIEQPISNDLDISGWDLRKTLGLMRDSNPTLLEWLRSPIVYRQEQPWVDRLSALAEASFSPVRGYHHYVSMAKKNLREHLYGETVRYKKYLYVLRPLLAAQWIREGRGVPPMRFAELVAATIADQAVVEDINALLHVKMRVGESATSAPWKGIQKFIEQEMAGAIAHTFTKVEKDDSSMVDQYLSDAVMHFNSTEST